MVLVGFRKGGANFLRMNEKSFSSEAFEKMFFGTSIIFCQCGGVIQKCNSKREFLTPSTIAKISFQVQKITCEIFNIASHS